MPELKTFPLFGLGQQGKSPVVTAQRHLNLYAEVTKEADKSKVVFYGTDGTTLFSDSLGDTPCRGWIAVGNVFYVVHRGTFYEINNSATITSRGTLGTTSGRVDMAYDGAVILIVDGSKGWTYTVATTTFAEVTDADFPDGARTCAWLAGFFIVDQGTGDSWQISPDGTNWDALDFATAESAPDGLVRVFVDNGEVILFGETTTEYNGNTGGSGFPFSAIQGATQEVGLAARWSLTKFNSGLAALMKNRQGQVQVMFIQGYVPRPISSQELDALINRYSSVSDATAFSYMEGGHPFLQINFPSAGKSWLYDASTGLWSPLEYGLSGARHRAEMHLDFINRALVSDYSNGNIYELKPDVYTDNGQTIVAELIGRHVFANGKAVKIGELFVDMETGVGLATGQGSNPQAMLSVSYDGGRTFGTESWTTFGKVGKYLTRASWRRLGTADDWVFKIRITDPVKRVITYAAIRARA